MVGFRIDSGAALTRFPDQLDAECQGKRGYLGDSYAIGLSNWELVCSPVTEHRKAAEKRGLPCWRWQWRARILFWSLYVRLRRFLGSDVGGAVRYMSLVTIEEIGPEIQEK